MLARIDGNGVIETRDIAMDDVPPHKRDSWRLIVGDEPSYNKATHTRTGPTYQIEADRVLRVWQVVPRDLDEVKTSIKAKIDLDAEAARLKYITAGSGQALEYREVAEETARYAATGGAGEYPMLQASVSVGEAPSLAEAAALIAAREQGWAMIGAEIRRLRLTAKMAVTAAATVEQAAAAAEVVWP